MQVRRTCFLWSVKLQSNSLWAIVLCTRLAHSTSHVTPVSYLSQTQREKKTCLLKRPHSVCEVCLLLFVPRIKPASNRSHLGKREALTPAVSGETEESVPSCQSVRCLHCLPPWLILPGMSLVRQARQESSLPRFSSDLAREKWRWGFDR